MEMDDQTVEERVILEKEHGFQLILHQRDFSPGVPIMRNIAEAVQKTRRMIMLLSRFGIYLLIFPTGLNESAALRIENLGKC